MFSCFTRRLSALLNRTHWAVVPAQTRRLAKRQRTVRPHLEILPDRILPSVDIWTGANHGVDINWSDGKNWSLGRAPGSGDIAEFTGNQPDGNSIDNISATIGGLQIDGTWGATLQIGALNTPVTLTLASGGADEWDSGTINLDGSDGTMINNGKLTLNGTNGEEMGGGGSFTNNGVIYQTGAGNLDIGHIGGSVANKFVNAAGATYDFQNNSSITNNGSPYGPGGYIINKGLIEKTPVDGVATGTSSITGSLTDNAGTFDAATGTIALPGGISDTNGTFEAAAGAIIDLTGGNNVAFTENGTFTGTGAGAVYLDAGLLTTGSSGATFNIASTLAFDWSGGTISVPQNATLAYNGTLTILGSGGVELSGAGTFRNNGTIDQTGTGNLDIGHAGGNLATTFINAAKAVYDFQNNSSITNNNTPYGPGGAIVNYGLIEKTTAAGIPTGTSSITGPLTDNAGTLNAATGTLGLSYGITDTNGTYVAAAGSTLDLTNGGTFSETGTFTASGSGTITLNGGTFSISNSTATLNIPSTVTFVWPGATIYVPTGDSLNVHGNLLLNGTNNEGLEGGGTMTEYGTITQSGTGYLAIGGTNTNATTLIIPAGSMYNFTNNSGIENWPYNGSGVVDNSGTIEKTGGGASSPISTAFNNTGGTINVTHGTLALSTSGGESTGGVFNVSTGAILDLTGGSTVTYSGTYTGSGTGEVLLGGGTLSVAGGTNGATFDLPGNLFIWSGGTIDTNGNTMTIEGNVRINSTNGAESLTSGNSSGGYLDIGGASSGVLNDSAAGNTLSIGSGTTLQIASNGTVNLADDTIKGNGAITNLGNLVKNLGTSGATISTYVDNEKNVAVYDGTLTLSGTVDQVFNNQLTGGSWRVVGANANAVLDISSASFNMIDPGVAVILNGPYASFANLSALTTNEGSLNLWGGASLTTAGNFTNAGTLALLPTTTLDSVLTVNGAFTQTSLVTVNIGLSGTTSAATCGYINSKGAVKLEGALKVTSSTQIPAVGTSLDLGENESSSAISGTFAGLAEGATFTVDGMTFKITYKGGSSGHDVVITRTA